MRDERASGDFKKQFIDARTHPGALTSGDNDRAYKTHGRTSDRFEIEHFQLNRERAVVFAEFGRESEVKGSWQFGQFTIPPQRLMRGGAIAHHKAKMLFFRTDTLRTHAAESARG